MACYRKGGCGPYEGRSCSECPASKETYLNKSKVQQANDEVKMENNEKLYGFYTILIPVENDIEGSNTLSKIAQTIYNDTSIKTTGAVNGMGLFSLEEEESFVKDLQNFMSNYCSVI